MAISKWQSVCQWCGKGGSSTTTNTDRPPTYAPTISGTCPSHPSGKSVPQWQQR